MYRDAEDNVAIVRRWFEEVWNKGREDAVDEMFAEEGVAHGLADESGAELRGPRRHPGIEDLVGPLQEQVDGVGAMPLLERSVRELREVRSRPERHEVVAHPEPWMDDLDLGDDIERPPAGRHVADIGERIRLREFHA